MKNPLLYDSAYKLMSITITNKATGMSRLTDIPNGIALVRLDRSKRLCERAERTKRNTNVKPVAMRRRCIIAACEPTETEIQELASMGIIYTELEELSCNEKAVPYLIEHRHLIDWQYFSANAAAFNFLLLNLHYVDADAFSTNPCAASFLMDNPSWIRWKYISINPSATDLILDNLDKIDNDLLKMNPSYNSILCQKVMRDLDSYISQFPSSDSEDYDEHPLPIDYQSDDDTDF